MNRILFSTVIIALSWGLTLGIDAQTSLGPPAVGNTPAPTGVPISRFTPDPNLRDAIEDRVLVRDAVTNVLQSEVVVSDPDPSQPVDRTVLSEPPVYESGLLGKLAQPGPQSLIRPFDITAPWPRPVKIRGGQPWTGSYGGTPPAHSIPSSAMWAELEGINIFTVYW